MVTVTASPLALLFDQWLAARRPHQCDQRAANARWFANSLLCWWKDLELAQLTEEKVGAMFMAREKGRSGATLNTERAMLSSFFGWCAQKGLITSSPMGSWPRQPEETQRPREPLTLEDEDKLCGEISCEHPEVVERYVRFLIATGLRPVSARRCRCQDVSREKGLYMLNLPGRAMKNRRGLRMVLSPAAVAVLPKPLPEKGTLFPGLPGRVAFWKIVTAAAKRARLGKVSPKTFRSTWVGRMCDAGATEREVMVLQGWRRANILVGFYYPEVRHSRVQELHEKVEGR